MNKLILTVLASFFLLSSFAQTITDIDGNVYNTVNIGNQIWMKENLRTSKYRNGNGIGMNWSSGNAACSNYGFDTDNDTIYGRLYNFYAIEDTRNVCPVGYNVPTDDDWQELSLFLGGAFMAGGKMKETGTQHWQMPNTGADNSSGFSGRPGGYSANAMFYAINVRAKWWSTKIDSASGYVVNYTVDHDNAQLSSGQTIKTYGCSVRCIAESPNGIENSKSVNFILYPNPAQDNVFIQSSETITSVRCINHLGQTTVLAVENNTVDVSSIVPGLYFLEITVKSGSIITRKFFKG